MSLRTNLGALTTVFTPPPECSTLIVSGTSDNYNVDWGFSCSSAGTDLGVNVVAESCYPPGLGSFAAKPCTSGGGRGPCPILNTVPFYSPGLSCPQGFTSACTLTRQEGDQPPATDLLRTASRRIWNELSIGETAIGCCPSGWACADDYYHLCHLAASLGSVVSGISFTDVCAAVPNMITVPTSIGTAADAAYRVQLVFAGSTPSPGQPPRTEPASPGASTGSPTSSASPPSPSASTPSSGQPPRTESANSSAPSGTSTSSISLLSPGDAGNSSIGFSGGAKVVIGAVIPIVVIGAVAVFLQ